MERNRALGRYLTFIDERKLPTMLRRAHTSLEDIKLVEMRERRPLRSDSSSTTGSTSP